jgi:hypothetical protein
MSREDEVIRRIDEETIGRRTAVVAAAAAMASARPARAAGKASEPNLAAAPPAGFVPFSAPGKIVKVTKAGCLQPNKLYPKEDDARVMLERAMTELTGKADLVAAVREFVHPADLVVVKVNGIALKNMSTSKELVVPFVKAMVDAGIPADHITLLEQYQGFFNGTRITQRDLPPGVKISIHNGSDATMPERLIAGTGVSVKFCKALTESTAVINFPLIKDHGICGYTGCLKNMTHGCQNAPENFHVHHASPQIALLYAQDVIKTRVRLHVTDGFKLMADGGPLYRKPEHVIPHESVYVTTDPVAMDTIGLGLVNKARADHHLPTLEAAGRPADYIRAAADLGLGIGDEARIQLQTVTL